jgi:hypothetical protein
MSIPARGCGCRRDLAIIVAGRLDRPCHHHKEHP